MSDYRPLLEQAQRYNLSDDGQANCKHRPLIECITPALHQTQCGASVANLTRYHDARQARRRGTINADYQAKKSGMAFNLGQWLCLRQKRVTAEPLADCPVAQVHEQPAEPNEPPDRPNVTALAAQRLPSDRPLDLPRILQHSR